MRTLLIKDYLSQKRAIPFYGLYSLIFFILFAILGDFPENSFIFVFSSIMIGFMAVAGTFKSDKGNTERFLLSLPIDRKAVVHEKMLFMVLGTLYGALTTGIICAILTYPPYINLGRGTIDPLDGLRIVTGMMILTGLLPFYLKFGVMIVKYALIVLLGFGVAAQVLVFINIASSEGPNYIDKIIAWFTQWTPLQRNLGLFVIGLVIFIISYIASLRIYGRKEI